MANRPAAEFRIDERLIRALLREQAPEFAALELRHVAEGWDNEIWRVGDGHAIRIPRRAAAEALIVHEQRWLRVLAPRLPLPVPLPTVAGQPTELFPRAWSIVPWLPGSPLGPRGMAGSMARSLAGFLRALHQPAPPEAPENDWRGVSLRARAQDGDAALRAVEDTVGPEAAAGLRERFAALVDAPEHTGAPVWLHGDLHPLNVLVDGEAITAVIDFGDVTSGDPASDLAIAWMGCELKERMQFRACFAHVDEATWARAQGWAILLGALVAVRSDDAPLLHASARATLRRVLEDES